jgi:hypothetical protein
MRPASLKIAVKDHLGKSIPIARALQSAGHRLVGADQVPDVLLIDADVPVLGYRKVIDRFKEVGATILLYPHGANVHTAYDGLYEPYEHVDGSLVMAPGHAEVLRRLGYAAPIQVIGWSLCEQRPFRATDEIRHVVFAPTHPSGFGTLADDAREASAETYARLLEGPWQLTVRHIGTLEQNGLWHADGVKYVQGSFEMSFAEMDAADVVVAGDGTYPSLAIARGVPTVLSMITTESERPSELYFGLPGETPVARRNPELYRDYIRYPFDMTCGPIDEVLHAAARSEAAVADYRRRFIGEPLDSGVLSRAVARVAAGVPDPAIDATRSFTVTAFADELLERPDLLRSYVERFGPQDDASLILWGPGREDAALLSLVEATLEAAGLDPDRLPDVLLVPGPGSAAADAALAARSDAVLSEWPAVGRLGELPRLEPAAVAA